MNGNNEVLIEDIKTQIYELYDEIKTSFSKFELEKLGNGTSQEITPSTEIPLLLKFLKDFIKLQIKEKKTDNDRDNNQFSKEDHRQLEKYIIKLEEDIKYFLKRQFQTKMQRDTLEMRIRAYLQMEEEFEDLKEKVKYDDGKFLDNDRKENEIIILRKENSLLKKEITILEKNKTIINKLEDRNKELEKINSSNEEMIRGLKYRIKQLKKKINDVEEELNNTKKNTFNNENNSRNMINNHSNFINIKEMKSRNKFDFNLSAKKISLEKFSLNNKTSSNSLIKYGLNNSMLQSNYESGKNNHNNATRTIDTYKYGVSLYNKKYNSNIDFNPIKNDIYQKMKKGMRDERSEKSKPDLIKKYLSGSNTKNKFVKSRRLNKIEKNIAIYKFPNTNKIMNQKSLSREHQPNKNSSLNILGINKNTIYG